MPYFFRKLPFDRAQYIFCWHRLTAVAYTPNERGYRHRPKFKVLGVYTERTIKFGFSH
jgi:hypothetical protein